jgi:hypothetical protein
MVKNYPLSRSVPPNSSRVYFASERLTTPVKVLRIFPNFAINTQRLLKIYPVVTSNEGYSTSGTDQTIEGGMFLLSADGFIVGDGQEGERSIEINRVFPAGMYLAIRAVNADTANPHTLDFSFEIEELRQ